MGLVSHDAAKELLERLQGCSFDEDPSLRCQASWSQPGPQNRGFSLIFMRFSWILWSFLDFQAT